MNRRSFLTRTGFAALTASVISPATVRAEETAYDPAAVIDRLELAVPDYSPSDRTFQRYLQSGNLIFLSGTTPFVDGQRLHPGIVGDTVTLEQGQEAARRCAIQLIGVMKLAFGGDWSKLDQIMRVEGFVRSADNFGDQPKVMNAASNLFAEVFGKRGRHTRMAIGVKELPFESSVEIAAIVSTKSSG